MRKFFKDNIGYLPLSPQSWSYKVYWAITGRTKLPK